MGYREELVEAEQADYEYEAGQLLREMAELEGRMAQSKVHADAVVPVEPKAAVEVAAPDSDPDSVDNRLRAELLERGLAVTREAEEKALRQAMARQEPGAAEAYESAMFQGQMEIYSEAEGALRKVELNRLRGEVQAQYDQDTEKVLRNIREVSSRAYEGLRGMSDDTRQQLLKLNKLVDLRVRDRDEFVEDRVREEQASRSALRASGGTTSTIGPAPMEGVETLEQLEARYEASKAIYGPNYTVAKWNKAGRP
jgi:hypothetical protein